MRAERGNKVGNIVKSTSCNRCEGSWFGFEKTARPIKARIKQLEHHKVEEYVPVPRYPLLKDLVECNETVNVVVEIKIFFELAKFCG
jgi:hypothetical protein